MTTWVRDGKRRKVFSRSIFSGRLGWQARGFQISISRRFRFRRLSSTGSSRSRKIIFNLILFTDIVANLYPSGLRAARKKKALDTSSCTPQFSPSWNFGCASIKWKKYLLRKPAKRLTGKHLESSAHVSIVWFSWVIKATKIETRDKLAEILTTWILLFHPLAKTPVRQIRLSLDYLTAADIVVTSLLLPSCRVIRLRAEVRRVRVEANSHILADRQKCSVAAENIIAWTCNLILWRIEGEKCFSFHSWRKFHFAFYLFLNS